MKLKTFLKLGQKEQKEVLFQLNLKEKDLRAWTLAIRDSFEGLRVLSNYEIGKALDLLNGVIATGPRGRKKFGLVVRRTKAHLVFISGIFEHKFLLVDAKLRGEIKKNQVIGVTRSYSKSAAQKILDRIEN